MTPESLRLTHVIPGVPLTAGGPAQSVPGLCEALSRAGARVALYSLDYGESPAVGSGVDFRNFPHTRRLARLGISPALAASLRDAAPGSDIVHSHGLWMMPNVYPASSVRGTRARWVVSPRGTLAEAALQRSRLRKLVFWHALQRRALASALMLHATSEQELIDIRRAGCKQPVTVIPNGVLIPDRAEPATTKPVRRRVLFLGRLHPHKRIEDLIAAWARLAPARSEWDLHLVGPSDTPAYFETLKGLVARLGAERVTFAGPAYGDAKLKTLRAADVLVLPSASENFGMVVAEALSHEVPVIASQGTPWAGLDREKCGWWISHGDAAIGAALTSAMTLSRTELEDMGRRGRDWMLRDFSWAHVAEQMLHSYRWLLGTASRPPCVREGA